MVAMVLTGLIGVLQWISYGDSVGSWVDLIEFQAAGFLVALHESFLSVATELMVVRGLVLVWFTVSWWLAFVAMRRVGRLVRAPAARRLYSNWATWGILLFGSGPLIALVGASMQKYSQPRMEQNDAGISEPR